MTQDDKYELSALVEDVTRLEQALHGHGFRNVFGLSHAELSEMRMDREVLECDLISANRQLSAFKARHQ